MKTQQNLPLVDHPEQLATHWPTVGTDHSLPLHHARTEASIGAGVALAVLFGAFILFGVREPRVWGGSVFGVGVVFLVVLLWRYEHHIEYVHKDRRPAPNMVLDLNGDGKPDRIKAIWYGGGAPVSQPGTLGALYSLRFAAFVVAAQRVGTTVRALRAEGYDDTTQALFKNWLLHPRHPAAVLEENGQWTLGDDATLRRVLRCTGWEADST
jgi:hypothetical protein